MEVLFSYKRSHPITLDRTSAPGPLDIRYLIKYLLDHLLSDKTRPELFAQGETVCVPIHCKYI